MQQSAFSKIGSDACLSDTKKKRGRKAQDNYLAKANQELEDMKSAYEKIRKELSVKERAKQRNRISALESRIKKRED